MRRMEEVLDEEQPGRTLFQALSDARSEVAALRVVSHAFRLLAETGDVNKVLEALSASEERARQKRAELAERSKHGTDLSERV